MLRIRRWDLAWLTCATALLGCATGKVKAPLGEAQTSVAIGQNCRRLHPGVGARPADAARASGVVALARTAGILAYIADADEATLRTVDVDLAREVAKTPLHGRAEQVMVLGDGRVAVTLRSANAVEILEPGEPDAALESRCVIDTPAEPIALAATPDDETILVTTGWAHTLVALDASTLAERFRVELAREPRAVVVGDDGARAFVAHVVGAKMSVVDLSKDARPRTIDLRARLEDGARWHGTGDKDLRDGSQGFALAKADRELRGRIFAPMVSVEAGDTRRPSAGYGDSGGAVATETGETPVVDAVAERAMTRAIFASRSLKTAVKPECLLPRASAYHDGSLYVSCLGIDAVLELDGRAIDPSRAETRRWAVGAGPTGLAVDGAGKRLVVFSQFDRQVDVVDLREQGAVAHVSLSRSADRRPDTELALGRYLFHKTHEAHISKDGRACASCHPDGREDALTWSTPDGPRQTPMLAGRLDQTAPYGWLGTNATLVDHVKQTFSRLNGSGLSEGELAALLAYVRALEPPRARALPLDREHERLVTRGRELFSSAEAECSTCHDPARSFADGTKHELRPAAPPHDKPFDTPSLKFVSGTAPYFHDGRYATLDDLLAAPDHAMGHVLQLSHDDRTALAAYLESL